MSAQLVGTRLGDSDRAEHLPQALLAWSSVHGLAVLLIDGPLKHLDSAHADAVGDLLLDHVEAGLLA